MKPRHFLAGLDTWLHPTVELMLGCVILVLSASFWISPAHPIWAAQEWAATVGAILGPLLVYRAWNRKPGEVKCDRCRERVPIVEIDDSRGHFYVIDCPRCGLHAPPAVS